MSLFIDDIRSLTIGIRFQHVIGCCAKSIPKIVRMYFGRRFVTIYKFVTVWKPDLKKLKRHEMKAYAFDVGLG